ncbi:zinc knuckle CX2CX4HX4C containing protein [Tanacetum coccineum]|uniref:Zinc knuckle CX2CX4HX4C containing protein n=1 Tax=Tanacetum coccineum TaxID=301880 RepID=A0ABQ4XJ62_9ASTR
MEILPESTSNRSADLTLLAGNSVKEILPKLNLPDHRSSLKISRLSRQKCQGRLLASFPNDAKYEHVGQDTRSQDGKDVNKNESLRDEVPDLKKVIKKWTSSKVILDQLLTEKVPGNIVCALGGREPLPPLLKILGAKPIGTSMDITPPADLVQTSTVSDKTKQVTENESLVKATKKKAQTKSPTVPDLSPDKKANSSTEQLLLTVMKEIKGLKEQTKPSSDNSSSVLHTRSSKSIKVSSLTTTDVQSDVSETVTNTATPVLHNLKGEPLKSILKNNNKVTFMEEWNNEGSFAFAAVGVVKGLNGMADVQGISDKSSTDGVCNSKAKKVNLYSLVHENVIPGANITLPKESVDEIANKFANTLYGHFIGCKHAFLIVDRYVKNAWARYGLKRSMFHHGFLFFQFSSKTGMEHVLANGSWRIRMTPIMLNIWNPTKKLIKDDIKKVSVWVKMHDVPIVAYSEVGLSLITTQVGRPIMLDAHTADMCVNSWGWCSYARALIEVDAEKALADSIVVAVPIKGEKGHSLETISIEYEWKPPRCSKCKNFDHLDVDCPRKPKAISVQNQEEGFVQVKRKKKQPMKSVPRHIEGIQITKPKTTLVYKAVTKPSPPKEKSSEESHVNDTEKPTTSKLIHDELDLMELKNSFDKLKEEGTALELVEAAVQEKSNNPKLSFGPLDLSNFSDSDEDEDEVFASQEEHHAYLASI